MDKKQTIHIITARNLLYNIYIKMMVFDDKSSLSDIVDILKNNQSCRKDMWKLIERMGRYDLN